MTFATSCVISSFSISPGSAPVLVVFVPFGLMYLCVANFEPKPLYSDSNNGAAVLSQYPFSDRISHVSGKLQIGPPAHFSTLIATLLQSHRSDVSPNNGSSRLIPSYIHSEKSTFARRHVATEKATLYSSGVSRRNCSKKGAAL